MRTIKKSSTVSTSTPSIAPVAATPAPVPTPAVAPPAAAPPPPQPAPTPAPDPNAALAAAVTQAVALLATIDSALALADPTLTPQDKRRSSKLRKGGEKYVAQIGGLTQQYDLETPAMQVATMLMLLAKAGVLQPLADHLTSLTKVVNDTIFASQSQAWNMALQYYQLLKRYSVQNGNLQLALQPITDFLAYRHPLTKPPVGSPTKTQVKAMKKAQTAITTVAGGKLAGTNFLQPRKPAAIPSGQPAAAAGAPAASAAPTASASATAAPAASPAPAAPPATNGGGAATHS
jgi:hypothetical protein